MDTKAVMAALIEMHDPKQWCIIEELKLGTGFATDSAQRLDLWAINYFPSHRNETICYEVKVSRGDLKNDLDHPIKKRAGMRVSNRFYFVTPKGLMSLEELPLHCGLMEVTDKGVIETTVEAPFRDTFPPTWLFIASLCRRFDNPRFLLAEKKKSAQAVGKTYALAAEIALKRHIDKWKHYDQGNKEVPDQIAEAMESLQIEIDNIIAANEFVE